MASQRRGSASAYPSVNPPTDRPPTKTFGSDVRPVASASAARSALPRRPRSSSSTTRVRSDSCRSSSKERAATHHGQSTNENSTTSADVANARSSASAAVASKSGPAASTTFSIFQSARLSCSHFIHAATAWPAAPLTKSSFSASGADANGVPFIKCWTVSDAMCSACLAATASEVWKKVRSLDLSHGGGVSAANCGARSVRAAIESLQRRNFSATISLSSFSERLRPATP